MLSGFFQNAANFPELSEAFRRYQGGTKEVPRRYQGGTKEFFCAQMFPFLASNSAHPAAARRDLWRQDHINTAPRGAVVLPEFVIQEGELDRQKAAVILLAVAPEGRSAT